MRWLLTLALLLAPALASAAPAQLIVLDLRAPEGPARDAAAALDAVLASEVGRAAGVAAVTQADLRTMLAADALQQLLGCDGDAGCTASRLGSTGAAKLVSGEVHLLDGTYVLALSIIDLSRSRVERRVSRTHAGGAAGLLPELRSAVEELLAGYGFKANAAPVAVGTSVSAAEAGESISLEGGGSYDPDGQPLTFHWRQLAGPAASISQPSQATTSATLPDGGRYLFGLTVSDGQLESPEAQVTVVARPAPKLQVEGWLGGLFGLPPLANAERAYRERLLQQYELTLAVPLTRATSITLGGGYAQLTTYPDTGPQDAELTFRQVAARAGVRRVWSFEVLRAGAGAELLLSRGYFDAVVHGEGGDREDGWHRAFLLGGGVHAFGEVPFGGGYSLVVRLGARYWREVTAPFAFDGSFVPFTLSRSGSALSLVGVDAAAGLARAF